MVITGVFQGVSSLQVKSSQQLTNVLSGQKVFQVSIVNS